MLSNRFFQIFLGVKSSRWTTQGSVLAPLLFSLYLSDIPSTLLNLSQYAEDIALTYQHESFSDCEANLEVDLERLNQDFYRWRLQPNPSKTKSFVFHLSTHHANRTLDIQFAATQIDIQLNNTMRFVSGTVKSTQLKWLPVLANISPPKLRCETTIVFELVNCRRYARSLLYEQMLDISDHRLLSRRSVWNFDPHSSTTLFSIPDAWTAAWSASLPVNSDLIVVPMFDHLVSNYDDIIAITHGCC
jgi:hypothetical protein